MMNYMHMSVLDVKNLNLGFNCECGFRQALYNVNFSLDAGKMHALVGESGCGKTMSAMSILQLLPKNAKITDGEILYKGKDLLKTSKKDLQHLRGDKIALIPQDPMTSLNPLYTVGNQLLEVIKIHQNLKGKEAYKKAIEALEAVQIPCAEERMKAYPHEFSGGMRQRAVMAIALAGNPKILFADEPTTALDVTIQAQILDVFRRIQKKLGMATVFISHDLGVVAGVADRVAVMYAGKIVEIGTAEEIFYDPRHPYTWGLLQSLPILSRGKEWLPTLPGMPPTLIHPPKGDAFAERNAYAMRIDYEKEPPMFQVTDTHYAATWLLDERAPEVKAPIGERRYGK